MSTDVVVAGSVNMDLVAQVHELPVAGETVLSSGVRYLPGGKGANQAVAAARSGARTQLCGCLGDDGFAAALTQFLSEEHIDLTLMQQTQGSSGMALINVSEAGENQIVVAAGANAALRPDHVTAVQVREGAVGVCQFESPPETITAFFKTCHRQGALTLLNTAPAIDEVDEALTLADILVLNESELAFYLNQPTASQLDEQALEDAMRAIQRRGDQIVVVTLGARGVLALSDEQWIRMKGEPVETIDSTGAGDCFVGYLASGLARSNTLHDALGLANRAAAVSVTRPGASVSVPWSNELSEA